MTLSPEERGRDLALVLSAKLYEQGVSISASTLDLALIATAIREAEDAALERAAADMDRGVDHGRVRSSSPFWAAHLRSLKSKGTQ